MSFFRLPVTTRINAAILGVPANAEMLRAERPNARQQVSETRSWQIAQQRMIHCPVIAAKFGESKGADGQSTTTDLNP